MCGCCLVTLAPETTLLIRGKRVVRSEGEEVCPVWNSEFAIGG